MSFTINDLSQLITCIAVGFVAVTVFHFVVMAKTRHIFLSSLVTGYFIYCVKSNLSFFPNGISGCGLTVLISVIIAYLFARLIKTSVFVKMCDCLKIQNSPNEFIWDDIIATDYPTKLIVYFDDKIIAGYPVNVESFAREPIVQLAGYTITDLDGSVISDCRANGVASITVNIAKAKYVEQQYYKESAITERIKVACSNNKTEPDSVNQ